MRIRGSRIDETLLKERSPSLLGQFSPKRLWSRFNTKYGYLFLGAELAAVTKYVVFAGRAKRNCSVLIK